VSALLRRILGLVAAVFVLFIGWELLARVIDSPALPAPADALADFGLLWGEVLLPHLGVSARRVFIALVVGLAIAVPLGLALGRSEKLDMLVAPLVFVTYPVPKIAFLPVFFVLLGTGDLAKVGLITLVISFQILVTARDAARGIPPASITSVRSLGASRWQVFRHVVIPSTLPGIFTAMRISAGHAIAVLFFSETIAGTDGLGYAIIDAWARIDYSEMFAAVMTLALFGVALYEALELAESRVCRWTRIGVR
jgi:NitT/TauT family transport system permease protein